MSLPQHMEALLALTLEKPVDKRAAFLDVVCEGDAMLRTRLEALIASHAPTEPLPTEPVQAAATTVKLDPVNVLDEAVGQVIGHYKLLEKVGEGGFGSVYVAEQIRPVRRRVAVKVIKLGMDTRQVVARFEAERQALAMMDHPNIAKVLDAGATEEGRPFFVMELVRGIRITDYCDRNHLSTDERIDLFIKVCQAIQHAHQKGIVHRDIKPSNILVTLSDGVPVPKVIDFGVAKAIEGRLTEATIYTQMSQFIGTPAYMSPEQAEMSGLDIDTRSDIYSLGVLLYELLTGRTPFDPDELMKGGIGEMRRVIWEREPPRPSTRIATLRDEERSKAGICHATEPSRLIRTLRGDLDWFTMKCLEKDRTRRYETANSLAMDLTRHLNNEPLIARPPSTLYRLHKSVIRNKLAYLAAAAIVAALVIGLGVATWMFVRERRAHEQALAAEQEQSRMRATAQMAEAEAAKEKAAAQQLLYDSLVGQARATRLARHQGYRDQVFALLEQARALDVPGKNPAELRREAVATLGDFLGLTPASLTNFPAPLNMSAGLDPSGKLAAFGMIDGTIQLYDLPTGKALARLTGTNGPFNAFCFNAAGDQLYALCGPPYEGPQPVLPARWLYTWSRTADGRWQKTGSSPLPGAVGLIAMEDTPFAVMLDVSPVKPGDPQGGLSARFRLFNLKAKIYAAGYDVTNEIKQLENVTGDFTPDGRLLAVESPNGRNPNGAAEVNFYDWKSGRKISQLTVPAFGPLSLSPDGTHVAAVSQSGGAIYTFPGRQRIGQFKEYFESKAVFCGDIVCLLVVHQNRIRLWNTVTREDAGLLDEPAVAIPAASSPDGNSLLAVGERQVWCYRLKTPENLKLPALAGSVPGVAFSSDGVRLASVSKNRVVRVCDALTGRTLWETNDLPGPGQCVAFSPDGQWLATGDYDTDLVWIWDSHTGQRLLELGAKEGGPTWSVQFSPDGRYLGMISGSGGIQIWTIEHGKSNDTGEPPKATPLKLLPHADGNNLMFSSDSRSVVFMAASNHEGSPSLLELDPPAQSPRRLSDLPFADSVECLGLTPDGRQLTLMDDRGEISTVDAQTGQIVSSFQNLDPKVAQVVIGTRLLSLSPDGSKLALSSGSGTGAEIWDARTGKLLFSLPEDNGSVFWLTWSPDSQRLAIARDDGSIDIWNLGTINRILADLGLNP